MEMQFTKCTWMAFLENSFTWFSISVGGPPWEQPDEASFMLFVVTYIYSTKKSRGWLHCCSSLDHHGCSIVTAADASQTLTVLHQPVIVQTSHLNTQPRGRWEPCCATDQTCPSTHLISPATAQVWLCCGSWIKASSSPLFSVCPNCPTRSDLSEADILIWAETWLKDSQPLML